MKATSIIRLLALSSYSAVGPRPSLHYIISHNFIIFMRVWDNIRTRWEDQNICLFNNYLPGNYLVQRLLVQWVSIYPKIAQAPLWIEVLTSMWCRWVAVVVEGGGLLHQWSPLPWWPQQQQQCSHYHVITHRHYYTLHYTHSDSDSFTTYFNNDISHFRQLMVVKWIPNCSLIVDNNFSPEWPRSSEAENIG